MFFTEFYITANWQKRQILSGDKKLCSKENAKNNLRLLTKWKINENQMNSEVIYDIHCCPSMFIHQVKKYTV